MTTRFAPRRLMRRDLGRRLAIRWRIDVVRRFTKDALADQQLLLADTEVSCVLDVGANVGHLSEAYLRAFPHARVIAFEVAPAALADLRRRTSAEARLTIVEQAVSDTTGDIVDFHLTPMVGTSSLLRPTGEPSETLSVTTVQLDDWCREHGVEQCDILKLDIEGAELRALEGASDLLRRGAIDLIYCEIRLEAETEGGALLHEVTARLARDGYRLHNLYGLVESKLHGIIYGNAVFLSPQRCQRLASSHGERAFIQRLGH